MNKFRKAPVVVAVDLRLAETYIPGFFCLAKGTALILVVSRFPTCVPLLMALFTCLYVDRSVRNESIFDGNAMLCTILGTHVINLFRSDPQNHQLLLAAASPPESTASSPLSSTTNPWGLVGQFLLSMTSIFLLMGIDMAGSFILYFVVPSPPAKRDNSSSSKTPEANFTATRRQLRRKSNDENRHRHPLSGCSRGATVVVNGLLIIIVLQTPVDRSTLVSPSQVVVRSYVFLSLCLVWTYAVGVRDMIRLLAFTSRVPSSSFSGFIPCGAGGGEKGNFGASRSLSSATIIQSFIPCHLRFTHLLLMSGTSLWISASASYLIIVGYIYRQHAGVHSAGGEEQQQWHGEDRETSFSSSPALVVPSTHPDYCIKSSSKSSNYEKDPEAGNVTEASSDGCLSTLTLLQ